MTAAWVLSQAERDGVVAKAAAGISSLCFFGEGGHVSDEVARAAAVKAEKSAYSRALVESQTTTGARPRCVPVQGGAIGTRVHAATSPRPPCSALTSPCIGRAETERAYFRILSQTVIESVRNGCSDVQAAAAASSSDFLDLSHGGREFMTAELATELLAPLTAPGEGLGLQGMGVEVGGE